MFCLHLYFSIACIHGAPGYQKKALHPKLWATAQIVIVLNDKNPETDIWVNVEDERNRETSTREFFYLYQCSNQRGDTVLRGQSPYSICLHQTSDCNCLHETSDCHEFLSPPALYSSLRHIFPVSTSLVLGLKAWATITQLFFLGHLCLDDLFL